jgi:hypothetical protein
MSTKLVKRINQYFGSGMWERMSKTAKAMYVALGAHAVWKQHKAKTLPNYTREKDPESVVVMKEMAEENKALSNEIMASDAVQATIPSGTPSFLSRLFRRKPKK